MIRKEIMVINAAIKSLDEMFFILFDWFLSKNKLEFDSNYPANIGVEHPLLLK